MVLHGFTCFYVILHGSKGPGPEGLKSGPNAPQVGCTTAARAVIFSTSTRNSLVVLPLAFAVPDSGPLVAAVIVTQTLVELASEVVYVRWVPRLAPHAV